MLTNPSNVNLNDNEIVPTTENTLHDNIQQQQQVLSSSCEDEELDDTDKEYDGTLFIY